MMKSHPRLCLRTSLIVNRVREEATEEGLRIFLWKAKNHIIERNMTPDHGFNMDETVFLQKIKSKKVISVHVSQNIWSNQVDASSLHFMMVAVYNAKGFVIPPLFIILCML